MIIFIKTNSNEDKNVYLNVQVLRVLTPVSATKRSEMVVIVLSMNSAQTLQVFVAATTSTTGLTITPTVPAVQVSNS